jgi:hypothetical protein
MADYKLVKNYPIKKYKCGLQAGDYVKLIRNIVIKDHNNKPTRKKHLKGEIWRVLPGAKESPVVVWFRQADGDRHTWDDDETIFRTFQKMKKQPKKMGKYRLLIEGLSNQGKYKQSNHDTLIKADHHAFKPLTAALLDSHDPLIREGCAEILAERKSSKAIPFLIKSLLDISLYVRQDALWAIEKLSEYQIGGLQDWLDITNMDKPKKLHDTISAWYNINKHYIKRI